MFEARKQFWNLLYALQSPCSHDRGLYRTALLGTELLDKGVTEHVVEAAPDVESVCAVREQSDIEVDLARRAKEWRAELDGLAAALLVRRPKSVAVAHLTPLVFFTLDRSANQVKAFHDGLRGFFFAFLVVFFFDSNVSCVSQAGDVCVILRWSSAEVNAQREPVLRVGVRAVKVDGVVAEQQAVDPVPNLRREIEEAEATLALRAVDVLAKLI